jgi:hypothetical protein
MTTIYHFLVLQLVCSISFSILDVATLTVGNVLSPWHVANLLLTPSPRIFSPTVQKSS